MTPARKQQVVAALTGTLFGLGLTVAGMTLPSKVRGFLDFAGDWDPTLMFVMGGAITVHLPLYRLIKRRKSPVFAERFQLPTRKDIDLRLVLGAALFGVGWGLGGYCPGPGLTSLVSGSLSAVAFVLAMLTGMWLTMKVEQRAARPSADSKSASAPNQR